MPIDLNAIKAEFDRIESAGQSNFLDNFIQMPEGEGSVVIRLLPPMEGMALPFIATRTHKLNGKNIHCPMMLTNGKWQGNCPACNWYRNLWKQSDSAASNDEVESLQAEARAIKPVERYYWNAIQRTLLTKTGQTQTNVGPKIFSCGKQLQSKILLCMTGDDIIAALGDVTDINEGRDLRVIKRLVKGAGNEKYPGYGSSEFLNISVAGKDHEVKKWLENLHDLRTLRRILSTEEIEKEVRIHRGLEKDPDLEYNPQTMTESPVKVDKKPVVNSVNHDDDSEAMIEEDFLNKLRNM